jgi:hypothetical protein
VPPWLLAGGVAPLLIMQNADLERLLRLAFVRRRSVLIATLLVLPALLQEMDRL